MTAREFARVMDANYWTVLRWLKAGLVPGAARVKTPTGAYWKIPVKALKMKRPKMGRPRKERTEWQKRVIEHLCSND